LTLCVISFLSIVVGSIVEAEPFGMQPTFWSFRHFRAKTFWSFRQNDYFYVKNKQIAQLWKEEYSDARYTTRLRNGNHGQMVS
jgi:hypothetical protein